MTKTLVVALTLAMAACRAEPADEPQRKAAAEAEIVRLEEDYSESYHAWSPPTNPYGPMMS